MPQPTKTDLQVLLERHQGRAAGITAAAIAALLGCPERAVRELVTELRTDGLAVCGHPASGYFIAATREELEETCAFLRSRAMHSLVLEAKLRGMPLADLVGQPAPADMRTVKVRIALAITDDGAWIADGRFDDGTGRAHEAYVMDELVDMAKKMFNPPIELHWIEAEVPVPAALEPKTIPGTSRPASDESGRPR